MSEDIAAQLIADLEGEAEFIDGGGFSIDPEAARRKLADRQLADPDGWILLVMEAAELAGVDEIEIRERPLGLEISMRGAAGPALAPAGELDELFTWVFVELSSLPEAARRQARARQLLALGINAALARPVRSVALASITPEAGRRMLLRPSATGVIGAIKAGAPELELRFDAAVDTNAELFGRSELARVADRCGWGSAPIEILGRQVTRRPEPATVCAFRDITKGPTVLGRAELITKPVPASLTVIANGVELELIPLAGWAVGFRAVLYDGYERDLSLGHAIRSPAFDHLFNTIRSLHDTIVQEFQAQGGTVSFSGAAPARVDPNQGRTLQAMFNDAGNSIGHTTAWGAIGLGMIGGVAILAGDLAAGALLGVLALGCGAVAAYFLRMRKVFGDEG